VVYELVSFCSGSFQEDALMLPPAKTGKRPRVSLAEYEMWEKGGLDALTCLEESVVETCREMKRKSITLADFKLLIKACKEATADRSNAFESANAPAASPSTSPEATHG
jgi:hypothetical protein